MTPQLRRRSVCETADCAMPATHVANVYDGVSASPIKAIYCDECAGVLRRTGDEVWSLGSVDPFPPSDPKVDDRAFLLRRLECAEAALRDLSDEAARAVCEPRRFAANEDHRQQALGNAVARARTYVA